MRRGIWTTAILLFVIDMCRSGALPAAYAHTTLSAPANQLAAASNRLGFALLHRLVASKSSRNLFVSPLSATLALSMTYDGARGGTAGAMAAALQLNGMTQTEVRNGARTLLGSLQSADPHVQLDLADSLWMRQGVPFQASFLEHARTDYSATARTLDFTAPSAPATINSWVSHATHGKITEIIGRIPPAMVMYLLNAVYFNGEWTVAFDPKRTAPGPFITSNGATVRVPFMNRTGGFESGPSGNAEIVSVPYGRGRFSMVIALPTGKSTLAGIARSLNASAWAGWLSTLHTAPKSQQLSLPRFSMSSALNLRKQLAGLGMGRAFARDANFSGLCTIPRCRISEVKQKTYLKVNEQGTEAAAATGVGIGATAMPQPIIVDHPFFLAIRDARTGAILFVGTVDNPSG
ncbi:MAG TPA: serpin family protein [Chloroflexota bacterium]